MSYYDSAPAWHRWVDNGLNRLPRLAVLALIAMAWATTLAWPPPPPGSRPLVAGMAAGESLRGYPLRLPMPEARPLAMAELAEMVAEDERIADLGIDIPGAQVGSSASSISGRFAAAFSSLIEPSRPAPAAIPAPQLPQLAPGEMLDVDYDLAQLTPVEVPGDLAPGAAPRYNAEDGSLVVSKPLLVDGQSRGSATIRIEQGAQIMIATASLADALGPRAEELPSRISNALASRSGFIPFNDLRGAGITVEYDPVRDRVSLSTAS